MPWEDVNARFKIAICDLLFPSQAVVEDDSYEMMWRIPRVVANPFVLKSQANYDQLLKKAMNLKEPNATIIVEERLKQIRVSLSMIPSPKQGAKSNVVKDYRKRKFATSGAIHGAI